MTEHLTKRLGATIRTIRNAKALSLDAVAEKTGLTGQAIRRIETGETRAKIETLARIADALEVRPGVLFFLAEQGAQKNSPRVGDDLDGSLENLWFQCTRGIAAIPEEATMTGAGASLTRAQLGHGVAANRP